MNQPAVEAADAFDHERAVQVQGALSRCSRRSTNVQYEGFELYRRRRRPRRIMVEEQLEASPPAQVDAEGTRAGAAAEEG